MTLQIIKSIDGKDEYVLLPITAYKALKREIDNILEADYEPFVLEDYVDSPVALARIKANLSQLELAELMQVSQAYISKLESKQKVSAKTLAKVHLAIKKKTKNA
ncbi:MAG: helix-turn-helix domain-containing protein [Candidatus Berkiella sp.]